MARKLVIILTCVTASVLQDVAANCQWAWNEEERCNVGCSFPVDCSEIFETGQIRSGVYKIQPLAYHGYFHVYCDMDTDGGGWTIFQRRLDGSVGFFRDWADYKAGFGNVNSEYWLGNERLFHLTAQGSYELRVDMEDFDGESRYASYDHFRMGDEETKYKLFLGAYNGTAGDSLGGHANYQFSTKDADHDTYDTSCATRFKGGWWYSRCHGANLNGLYLNGDHESYADGINWSAWKGYHYSFKIAEMKIRRL